jgi:zinc/manganese transport system substrate-binding protein
MILRFLSAVLTISIISVPGTAAARLKVVATLPDFASIASEIGGDRVDAESFVKGAEDPHFVDPKPSFVMKMSRADLLIVTGLGLEDGWLPSLLNQARNGKVLAGAEGFLDASTLVTLKDVVANADRAMGDIHGGGNPHYYTGPTELKKVAEGIFNRLKKLDPAGAAYYEGRWAGFLKKFEASMAAWAEKASALKGAKVVAYHKSWVYLEDWLGLVEIGTLEPKPGIPPSAGHVAGLLAKAKAENAGLLIQEIYHPTNLSRKFAEQSGMRMVVLPSMVGAEPSIKTVWDKFDRILELLR